MGIGVGVDALSERAMMMRESVQKSQTINDIIISILSSFNHRLSALETAMGPTQVGLSHSPSQFLPLNLSLICKSKTLILSPISLS